MVPRPPRHELLRAADCVLAERNFSTTELTASPNNPDCEMGASSKNTLSFSRISVRFSHKWCSAATGTRHRAPQGTCGVLSGSESPVSGFAQLFHSLYQTSPFVHILKYVRLVGLKDGHRVRGHACLTGRDVGPSRIRAEVVLHNLVGRRGRDFQEGAKEGEKVGGQSVLYHRHGRCNPAPHNHKVGEVSGRCVSQAGGKNICFRDLEIS